MRILMIKVIASNAVTRCVHCVSSRKWFELFAGVHGADDNLIAALQMRVIHLLNRKPSVVITIRRQCACVQVIDDF